eukprot:488529_1
MEQSPSIRRPRWSKNNIEEDTPNSTVVGVIVMLISGSLYAILAALVKWSSNLGYNAANVLFYRAAFQTVLALLTSMISFNISCIQQCKCSINVSCNLKAMIQNIQNMSKSDNKYTHKEITGTKLWIAILCRGMFGAAATFTYFESADLIPIGSATTLISLSCISASFFGWIFVNDEITKFHCSALFLGVIGAILISQPEFIFKSNKHNSNENTNDIGYVIALISALMGGFVYLTIKMAKKAPLFLLITSQGLCCIILSLILIYGNVMDDNGFKGIDFNNTNEMICIISLGFVGFIAQWTLTKGAQKLIAGVSSLLRSSTNMTVSFILEMFVFGTYPDFLTIVGAIVALFAVILVSMEKIRKAQKEEKRNVNGLKDQEASLVDAVNNYEDKSVNKSVQKHNIIKYKNSTSII